MMVFKRIQTKQSTGPSSCGVRRIRMCLYVLACTTLLQICSSAAHSQTLQTGLIAQQTPGPPTPSEFIPFSVPTTKMPAELRPAINTRTLTLSQSLDESLTMSPRMEGVRALLGIARSSYAKASEMPNIGVYLAYNFGNAYLTGASIPIEPPWKLAFRLLVAKHQVEQTKLQIIQSMWQFRGEVRRNYAQLVMAQELLQAREELMRLSEKVVETTKIHFENGNVPGLDVRRAKLAYIQAKMDWEQAKIQVKQAKEQLNVVMGHDADADVSVPGLPDPHKLPGQAELLPDFKQTFPTRDDLIKTAKENRIELKLAKEAIALNHANLRNAYGNILPTPRFATGYLRENNPPTGPKTDGAFFQAYVDLPTLNVNQGDIARFRATGKQLKLDLSAQENLVTGQVALAYSRLLAARERIRAFQDEALPEAEGVGKVSRMGYEFGQTDLNTLLDAQRATIQTKTQYLDAVLVYQLAVNDLEQAIGKPLQ